MYVSSILILDSYSTANVGDVVMVLYLQYIFIMGSSFDIYCYLCVNFDIVK